VVWETLDWGVCLPLEFSLYRIHYFVGQVIDSKVPIRAPLPTLLLVVHIQRGNIVQHAVQVVTIVAVIFSN
jgi:hypothetical protein